MGKQNDVRADAQRGNVSRRVFIGGIGVGAVGALAPVQQASAAVAVEHAYALATPPNRFGRIFPDLPAFAPATSEVKSALIELGKPGGLLDAKDPLAEGPINLITRPELSPGNRDNPFHTAGTTFMGQFLDHDMTFDASSPLGQPTPPEASTNSRTPSFDLDSVYGGGPAASPALYDDVDRAKLKVGSNGRFEDLPRAAGRAVIGDPRNDENLIIAGLHAAFLLVHNRVVDLVRTQTPGLPASSVFEQARRQVTWHYQWIILHETLPQFIGQPAVDDILAHGRRHYRPPAGQAYIPVEFQGAAYRFGHSMVRPSYRANLAGNDDGGPFFGFIFDPAEEGKPDPGDLRGGFSAPRRFIGWQTFFDFRDGQVKPNKRIDTKISTPLFRLPLGAIATGEPPTALPQRNLLRQLTWSMPSGQRVAEAMRLPVLGAGSFPELQPFGLDLAASTPLWYYVLKEAEVIGDGILLGPVGARIVGEVFIGLLQLDSKGYLAVQPSWRPNLPSRTPGSFVMSDLLTYARVDPASRGQ